MNMLSVDDVKWVQDSVSEVKKISEKVAAAAPAEIMRDGEIEDGAAEGETTGEEPKSAFAKMKAFVRKAVDCCIE